MSRERVLLMPLCWAPSADKEQLRARGICAVCNTLSLLAGSKEMREEVATLCNNIQRKSDTIEKTAMLQSHNRESC